MQVVEHSEKYSIVKKSKAESIDGFVFQTVTSKVMRWAYFIVIYYFISFYLVSYFYKKQRNENIGNEKPEVEFWSIFFPVRLRINHGFENSKDW